MEYKGVEYKVVLAEIDNGKYLLHLSNSDEGICIEVTAEEYKNYGEIPPPTVNVIELLQSLSPQELNAIKNLLK